MSVLIDTDVTVHVRDVEPVILQRLSLLDGPPVISVVTHVELENGVYRQPQLTAGRRIALDRALQKIPVLPFGNEELRAHRAIVSAAGYVRSRVLDRMIAATAIVHGLSLVTINGPDFRDIPGLTLEIWPAPGQ